MAWLIVIGIIVGLIILIKTGILRAIFEIIGTLGHVFLVGVVAVIIIAALYGVVKLFVG